jgi:hypothetical protein
MAEDDRSERGSFGDAGPQTFGPAEPVLCEDVDPPADLRLDGDEGAVVVRLDPEDARRLRCPIPGGVGHAERDRQLPDHVTGPALADHALHAIGEPDHFDPPLEHAEQRRQVTGVRRILAGHERDIRRHAAKPIALDLVEVREHRDPSDLLRRHHDLHRRSRIEATTVGALETPPGTATT